MTKDKTQSLESLYTFGNNKHTRERGVSKGVIVCALTPTHSKAPTNLPE